MEKFTIGEEFFETRADLVHQIENFEKKRGLKLLQSLLEEKDEANFFSILAEVRFGLFFDPLCGTMQRNYLIDEKRPDWYLLINSQDVLIEILRLNTPEEEYRENIQRSRELRRFQRENPGVPIITYGTAKSISTEFLCGAQSKLTYKEEKYREIIQKYKLPFILCVAPTLETFLSQLDFSDFLMGKYGFFASDENFGNNVTGVLLHSYFGEFYYFHNNRAIYQLHAENMNVINQAVTT